MSFFSTDGPPYYMGVRVVASVNGGYYTVSDTGVVLDSADQVHPDVRDYLPDPLHAMERRCGECGEHKLDPMTAEAVRRMIGQR